MELTSTQKRALEMFDQLARSEGSANKAAAKIGISSAAISSIKNGTYAGNVENQLDKLIAYFNTKAAAADVYQEQEYVPTSISAAAFETIRTCKIKGGFSLITGHAGIGKTKAVQEFHRQNPIDSIVVTVNPCCKSTKSLLKLIALQLGAQLAASTDDLWFNVCAKLHDGMVIIIDEGQLLTYHGLETVRSFSDYFADRGQTLGVAIVGNNGIRERIEGKTKDSYRQINNRTWQRRYFETKDVQYHDIEQLFPILTAEDKTKELAFLHKVAQSAEGIRGAVRLFGNAYDAEAYDLEGLANMAKFINAAFAEIIQTLSMLWE
ncbi:MAG: ATP-binding protein [Ruminococcaceae bacterium]|nr:ATP-binding protein [Oscillospiraceae bacterium]